jgi:AcrR family transcriptional regulator
MSESQNQNKQRGRPRNEAMTTAVLSAALDMVDDVDFNFKAVTMEGIAARAGVAKKTVYRRWPGAWAIALDAFLSEIAPLSTIEPQATLRETVRADMKALAAAFRKRPGRLLAPMLGLAQLIPELREALWERYIAPHRTQMHALLMAAKHSGEVRPELDADATIDALYGSLVYKLLVPHGELSDESVDALVDCVFGGIAPQ